MAAIFHNFPINAPLEIVFNSVSTPKGLDIWWSKSSKGIPAPEEVYDLYFGNGYFWVAVVSKYVPNKEFELTMTKADGDWMDTKVGFSLINQNNITYVHFYH